MSMRELVATHLRPTYDKSGVLDSELTIALGDQATALAAEAGAGCGLGFDHFGGEHVLAAVLLRETPRQHEHRLVCALTDRRTLLSGWSSIKGGYNELRFSIRHDAITRVQFKHTMLSEYIKLSDPGGCEHQLTFGDANKQLGPLFEALARVPPQLRVPPPIPMPQPSEADPGGCATTNEALWRPDPTVTAALMQIDQLVRGGHLDGSQGYDFACRLLLLHRSAMTGPGSNGQTWLSPMISDDLIHTVAGIYGPPVQHHRDANNWIWAQFRVDPQTDALSPMLTALGVAAFVGVGIGFSPGRLIADQMLKRQPITSIRIGACDQSGCSMYAIQGPNGPLERSDALMAHRLHQALIHSAYRVLERRSQLGWSVDYPALFA